ncbi:MAG: hypothetical protein WBW33_00730 [Bryobacteraceae bacterium]
MNNYSSEHMDLSLLRAHLSEKPRTKIGQIRQAWPDIKNLISAGHSLKDICRWLNEIGVNIGYARLSHYLGELRRLEATNPGNHRHVPSLSAGADDQSPVADSPPL